MISTIPPVRCAAAGAFVGLERPARSRRLPVGAGMVTSVRPDRIPGHRRPGGWRAGRRHRCRRDGRAHGHDRGGAAAVGPRAPARSGDVHSGIRTCRGDVRGRRARPHPAGAAGGHRAVRPRRAAGAASASPQRLPFVVGARSRENRRGRTGHDAPLVLAAGTRLRHAHGRGVGACMSAWSGNHRHYAERLSTGARLLGGGELLLPGEVALARGRVVHQPVGVRRLRRRPRRRWPRRFHALAARPSAAPAPPAAGRAQHLGGGLLRPRPRPADRARRRRPRRSASSGSCSTTAGSATVATTPPGSATGTSTSDVWPDGLHPLVDARARARHGVRAVGRARDGQPGLRPRPRAPRLDAAAPAAGCRCSRATSRCSTSADPGRLRLHPRAARRAARPSTPSRTSSGTTTATCSTRAAAGRARPACTRRPLAVYRLLDELRARHPGRRDRVVLVGRRARRPRDPGAHRPGLGQRQHRLRSSASRSSAGPTCCCRPS